MLSLETALAAGQTDEARYQDLMTAALDGLITKLDLKGQTLGDVALGAQRDLFDALAGGHGDKVQDRIKTAPPVLCRSRSPLASVPPVVVVGSPFSRGAVGTPCRYDCRHT